MPTVSVIIPNYNHARYLPRRIESVLRQTFDDFDVVLMDDASSDDSVAILSQYAATDLRVRTDFSPANSGSTFKQWNRGVRQIEGKYVWIAESDDDAEPTLLATLVAMLDADPRRAIAYCRSQTIDADGEFVRMTDEAFETAGPRWTGDFANSGRDECARYLIRENTLPNASAVLFRRAAYLSVRGADESFRMCGDWDLWARMLAEGNVAYCAAPLNRFRTHGVNVRSAVSKRGALSLIEQFRVIGGMVQRGPIDADAQEAAFDRHAQTWLRMRLGGTLSRDDKVALWRLARQMNMHPTSRLARVALKRFASAARGGRLSQWIAARRAVGER